MKYRLSTAKKVSQPNILSLNRPNIPKKLMMTYFKSMMVFLNKNQNHITGVSQSKKSM